MARYTGPKCRLCRREGMKLFLKGMRCETEKCALARRDYPPGQVSHRRSKVSSYGEQLREKQKVKRFYGVMERQFLRYFQIASRSKGNTGETLMQLFERRLDNAVFRLGWARSRYAARQLIAHGHIRVGSRRVDVSSYQLDLNDEIGIVEKSDTKKLVRECLEETKSRDCPAWIQADEAKITGKVVALPTRDDVSIPVSEQLIVELLSK